jgi:hypothetical protein
MARVISMVYGVLSVILPSKEEISNEPLLDWTDVLIILSLY